MSENPGFLGRAARGSDSSMVARYHQPGRREIRKAWDERDAERAAERARECTDGGTLWHGRRAMIRSRKR